MPLYSGPMRRGIHSVVQDLLLRVAFLMQDIGEWGRTFEDWVAPCGPRVLPQVEPYWRKP